MKILMPGFCRACASLVSACLLVAISPSFALPDAHLTNLTSRNLHEPAAIQPLLTPPAPPGPKSSQVSTKGRPKAGWVTKTNTKSPVPQGSRQITFIENKGQFDEQVKFQVTNAGRMLWLTQSGIVFDFQRCAPSNIAPSWSTPISPEPAQIAKLGKKKTADCVMERHVINQDFLGSSEQAKLETKELQPGVHNYLTGSDPAKWQTEVRGFLEVVYHDVWPGIDLRLYGKGPDLEQEFIVNPGAEATQVQLAYRGVDKLQVGNDGSLAVRAAAGQMRETPPRIYQEISGRRVPVKGHFKLLSNTSYTFEIAAYDKRQPLLIDPTLLYSTFLGGSAGNNLFTIGIRESATGIAVDQSGNAYVTGFTQSPDFPVTSGAFQPVPGIGQQTFVSKLNPSGSALVYSTYLDAPFVAGIAVDQNGNAYVAGNTKFVGNLVSPFPTTSNAFSQSCSGTGYLTILNAKGDGLLYSTCFPSVTVTSMTIDAKRHAFVAGRMGAGLALTASTNSYQPDYPGSLLSAFVMEFDTTLSGSDSLVYSTYLGIPGPPDGAHPGTQASAVAVDSFGKIYLTGVAADGFPVTPGAFQTVHPPCILNGSACGFLSTTSYVAKLDPASSGPESLIYATYFGNIGFTSANAIAVDTSGNAYIAGATQSSLPTTPGAFQSSPPFGAPGAGSASAVGFITKLNTGGSQLVYSTYLANACIPGVACFGENVTVSGIALDALGNAYVTGTAGVNGVPVTPDAFQSTVVKTGGGSLLAFVSRLNPVGTSLIYSSLLSGSGDDSAIAIAVDQIGDAYIVGQTNSFDLPTTPAAFQPAMNGSGDAFVTKFPLSGNQALAISSLTPTIGGNSGTVSPQIFGTGFHAGATAQLNCGSAVSGTNLTVGQGGRFLNTTFNLNGVPPSTCDVVVTNPDGTSASLPQAFTVQQGGEPNIQLYLTGVEARKVPSEVPIGPADVLLLATLSNTGTIDTDGLVSLTLNPDYTLTSANPPTLGEKLSIVTADIASTGSSSPQVNIWLLSDLSSKHSIGLGSTARTAVAGACGAALWGPLCFTQNLAATVACITEDTQNALNCSAAAVACGAASACVAGARGATALCNSIIQQCIGAAKRCLSDSLVQECIHQNATSCTSNVLPCIQPSDPNNLVGPAGAGTQQWMAGAQALSYVVSFENEPDATAPAQQVIVKQPLGSNVNLGTLQLLGITLPDGASDIQAPVSPNSLNPSAGNNDFTTSVDLRPGQNLLVSVDASLDSSTQTLTWTFTSIDPVTGQPPLNPLIGFLPAGAGANISVSVTPKQGLPTGSQIAEQATITFQGADPLSTQVWTNTIDNTPPVSQVAALSASEPASGFTLTWSGTDVGSGVQDFTIFVSDNGGPFTPFQTNTTATSATFTGEVGHTYGFYSVARDLVGNVEANKTAAETTTQVVLVLDNAPPTTSALAAPSPNAAGWNNSNVTVTLNSADDPGGTGVKQISYSATGPQPIASTTATGVTASFQVSAEGITTIAFFGTDNAGNVEKPKTLTIELDKTPPSIVGSRTPLPNANGWNNTDVTISFACADTLSGLLVGSPPPPTVLSTEAANQSVTGVCQDLAGNSSSTTVSGLSIDKTPPIVSCSVSPNVLWPPNNKLVPVNAYVTVTDSLSGSAGFNLVSVTSSEPDSGLEDIQGFVAGTPSVSGQLRAQRLGSGNGRVYTLTYSGLDRAGNPAACTTTVTVPHNQGH